MTVRLTPLSIRRPALLKEMLDAWERAVIDQVIERVEAEVEARCLLAMSLFIGAPLIAADYKGRSRTDTLTLAAQRLLA